MPNEDRGKLVDGASKGRGLRVSWSVWTLYKTINEGNRVHMHCMDSQCLAMLSSVHKSTTHLVHGRA